MKSKIEYHFPFAFDVMWWVLLVFIVISAACIPSVGAVGKKHDNSLGVPMFFDNPMTYKAGSVTALAYIDGGLVMRIQPIGTYGLFTEDILFCGMSPEPFLNKTNPMVITYRTKASRLIQGVGCHELVAVHALKTEKIR